MNITKKKISSHAPLIISSSGLDKKAQALLVASLNLVSSDDIRCFYLGNSNHKGHVVVVDLDSEEGRETFRLARDGQVKLVLSHSPIKGKNVISLSKPLVGAKFYSTISALCIFLSDKLKTLREKSGAEHNVAMPQASLPIFQVLYDAKLHQKIVRIDSDKYPHLFVDGIKGIVSADIKVDEISALVSRPVRENEVSDIDRNSLPADGQVSEFLLDDVLWAAGLSTKTDTPIAGTLWQPVKLRAWPNFTRREFHPDYLKLAAAFSMQAISIERLQESLGLPLEDIVAFYNAAYATGLIEAEVANEELLVGLKKKQINEDRMKVLEKLSEKLNFG